MSPESRQRYRRGVPATLVGVGLLSALIFAGTLHWRDGVRPAHEFTLEAEFLFQLPESAVDGRPVMLGGRPLWVPWTGWNVRWLDEASSNELPFLLTGAALAVDRNQLWVIGGELDGEPQVDAHRVAVDVDGQLSVTRLPDLPHGLSGASAVIHDGEVKVVGGWRRRGTELIAHERLLALPVRGAETAIWSATPLPDLGKRERPLLVVNYNALHILGGEENGAEASAAPVAFGGWRFRGGTEHGAGWRELTPAPMPLQYPVALPVGQSQILVMGQPVDGDRAGQDRVVGWAYHSILDRWQPVGSLWRGADAARHGAGLTPVAGQAGLAVATPDGAVWNITLRAGKKTFMSWDYLAVILYLSTMIGIGVYYARKERTGDDFFVGGRRVPVWAVAISAQATGASAISFMAIPARAFATDLLYFGPLLLLFFSNLLVAFFFIPILRRMNLVSIFEYLEARFAPWLRLLGSGMAILTQMLGRMGVTLLLPALALQAVIGLDLTLAVIIMGVVAIIYTSLGGINSVIWSDIIQFTIMIGGTLFCLVLILTELSGGPVAAVADSWQLGKLRIYEFSWDLSIPTLWGILMFMLVGRMFENLSDQPYLQRVMATKDVPSARKAVILNYVLAIPVQLLMVSTGIALYLYFREFPDQVDPLLRTDTLYPQFIVGQLPPGMSGLLITGILAAAMSTLDSSMNSVSTLAVVDFLKRWRPALTDRGCLRAARLATVVAGMVAIVVALAIAAADSASLWDVFLQLMALFGSGFPGVFALGLMTRRGTSLGAATGLLAAVTVVFLIQRYTTIHPLYQMGMGTLTSLAAGYAASWLPFGSPGRPELTIHNYIKPEVSDRSVRS